jgi:hypothetical protein
VTDDIRQTWRALRQRIDAAAGTKAGQEPTVELTRQYAGLGPDERAAVDPLIAEWVLSDDPGTRYDGLALVSEFRIEAAVPALRELAARLEDATGPGAPYEWAKVNRILGRFV